MLLIFSPILRRASSIAYDISESLIIVTDRTGDAYSFPWPLPPEILEKYNKIKSLPAIDEKNPLTKSSDERFFGTFLLGHSSSVVASTLATASWGRALVTGDRDEHVRISVFPQTWVIHAMAMGHTAFLSSLLAVRQGIVSGGGDNRLILWDLDGNPLAEHTISHGTCVKLIRVWNDLIVAVGEKFVPILFG